MTTWSIYNAESGHIVGVFSGAPEHLSANLPGGYRAIEGQYDPVTQRVDIASGLVETWRPAPPAPGYEWIDGEWREPESLHRRRLIRQIEGLEAKQARPLREIATGSGGEASRERLHELDIRIAALRAQLP